jgi:hypothetical protein
MRIVIVGDSYTFGHGCSDREYYYDQNKQTFVGDYTPFDKRIPSNHCWAALLQQQYPNIEVVNLAMPGHCSQGMFRDLTNYYYANTYSSDDIVMFHGTFANRIEVALGDRPDVTVPWVMGWDKQSQDEARVQYNIAKKMYVTHLFNNDIGYNLSITGLMSAYAFASVRKMKFIWTLPTYDYSDKILKAILPAMNDTKIPEIVNYDYSGKFDFKFNQTCVAPDFHVNDKGHAIYFEREILPAVQRLL